jgi:hypothetical protein
MICNVLLLTCRLYLVTRQPEPYLPPDACSLVSPTNFTVTRSGLEGAWVVVRTACSYVSFSGLELLGWNRLVFLSKCACISALVLTKCDALHLLGYILVFIIFGCHLRLQAAGH